MSETDSFVMEAVMHHGHKFKLNSLRHVEPMQVNMHKLHQTTIKLARVTNKKCCRIQQTL